LNHDPSSDIFLRHPQEVSWDAAATVTRARRDNMPRHTRTTHGRRTHKHRRTLPLHAHSQTQTLTTQLATGMPQGLGFRVKGGAGALRSYPHTFSPRTAPAPC